MHSLGVVVIGRNESDRLIRCIKSIEEFPIVYVDSGSTDGSVSNAQELGCEILELDMSRPFSAARARNAGFELITKKYPELNLVQFVDGDCEVEKGWLEKGCKYLSGNPSISVVCGRRKERFPEESIYNHFCDIEWNTPVGEARSTGGDFMIYVSAIRKVGGFNPLVVAGEEPELCFRLRQCGKKIQRIDEIMTLHDANMHRFSQWWKRTERSGHANAQGAWIHGKTPEKFRVRETLSIVVFGGVIPITIIICIFLHPAIAGMLILIYPLMFLRIKQKLKNRKEVQKHVLNAYIWSILFGKIPQFLGAIRFWWRQILGKSIHLIEYK